VLRPIQEIYAGEQFEGLLVGLDIADDAAIYQITEDTALVITLDFFTPIVDDPFAYGAIAAANSLSDIYAMGARPLLALNVAALPKKLPIEIGAEIIRGGASKAREAGIPIAGGHTIQDEEPKYGLVAVGLVHPQRIVRKRGARPGDALLLSKPLGAGVITTGLMRDKATPEEIATVTEGMLQLNRAASELALAHGVHAMTDVTGFGLLGHGWEIAEASGMGLVIDFDALPWYPGAQRLGEAWTYPGGAFDNKLFYGPHVSFDPSLEEWQQMLCFGPETSGGLLMALAPEAAARALAAARAQGLPLWQIGHVTEESGIRVVRGG
jgi:selenide,water dikinase